SAFLEWLVDARSKNQKSSLKLFKILKASERHIKRSASLTDLCNGLIAISFSLWRAAFLARSAGEHEDRFDHALHFLGTLICDNAIAYTQDKNSHEWTVWYYLSNSGFRLENLAEAFDGLIPNYTEGDYNSTARQSWEICRENLETAVKNLPKILAA
ncbi:MAG: hypothetical protein V4601_10795, partial [Pseudomonadota bacterium]